jgi:hypothetical protein
VPLGVLWTKWTARNSTNPFFQSHTQVIKNHSWKVTSQHDQISFPHEVPINLSKWLFCKLLLYLIQYKELGRISINFVSSFGRIPSYKTRSKHDQGIQVESKTTFFSHIGTVVTTFFNSCSCLIIISLACERSVFNFHWCFQRYTVSSCTNEWTLLHL